MAARRRQQRHLAAIPDRPQRVVAYRRVSALMGRHGDDFHSPEVQLDWIRRKTVGMKEVAVIDDIDVPGTDFQREGIDKVRQLAQAGHMDVLAVYNISRFGRNTLESLLFLNELADHGVTIISAKEHVDTSTPNGRKHLTDLLSGAQLRSEEIGEAWAEVIEARALAGQPHGKASRGYLRHNKNITVDPALAPAVQAVFTQYADGHQMAAICRNYHTASGGRYIDPSSVKAMLRNPTYIGQVRLNGQIYASRGAYPALIDHDTWDRVQARLQREEKMAPRAKSAAWSLAGLVFCPDDHPVHNRGPATATKGCPIVVACSHRPGGGKLPICKGIGSPRLDEVEAAVLEETARHIEQLKLNPHAYAEVFSRRASARADVASVEAELKKTRGAVAKLTTRWALDAIPDDAYEQALAELKDAEGRLEEALQVARQSDHIRTPDEVIDAATELLTLWPEALGPERARMLRTVIRKVVIRPSQRYREPVEDRVDVQFL